jgi:hypothetical protein
MSKKHGSMPKIHTCSGPDSHNEQTPALKVPLQMELHFRPHGYEQPPALEGPRGDKAPGGSMLPAPAAATTTSAPGGQTAAAIASGRTPLQQCPRPRLRSRGEDKLSKPKSRRPEARMVAVIPSATRTSSAPPPQRRRRKPSAHRQIPTRILPDERSTDLLGTDDRSCQPTGRSPLRSSWTSGAPSPRGGAVPGQRQDSPRTRMPP